MITSLSNRGYGIPKKNNDDKKYAAAHSIASGVIGFGLAFLFANPIAKAVEKLTNKPTDFMPKYGHLLKESKALNKTANTYLNQMADILISSPKAVLTIAIIPPILYHVFGLKKHKSEKASAVVDYSMINFKSTTLAQRKSLQNFMGGKN